jgi:hypothetical protein
LSFNLLLSDRYGAEHLTAIGLLEPANITGCQLSKMGSSSIPL